MVFCFFLCFTLETMASQNKNDLNLIAESTTRDKNTIREDMNYCDKLMKILQRNDSENIILFKHSTDLRMDMLLNTVSDGLKACCEFVQNVERKVMSRMAILSVKMKELKSQLDLYFDDDGRAVIDANLDRYEYDEDDIHSQFSNVARELTKITDRFMNH